MVIGEQDGNAGFTNDRDVVNQGARLGQNAVDQQGMVRGNQQVADREVIAEGASFDTDRRNAQRVGEDHGDGLYAEPGDRRGAAVAQGDQITGF